MKYEINIIHTEAVAAQILQTADTLNTMSEPIEKLVQEVAAKFTQAIRELPWYRKAEKEIEAMSERDERRHIPIEDRLAESGAAFVALEERLKRAIKESK